MMGAARIQYQANEREYVCLTCTVPLGCDESHPLCKYRQLRPAQDFDAANRRSGNRCPLCGKAITEGARTCAAHKWYK